MQVLNILARLLRAGGGTGTVTGAMAQLVARLTPDQKVGSSSLSGLIIFFGLNSISGPPSKIKSLSIKDRSQLI